MIYEMLDAGPEKAISATDLARVLGLHKRDVSKMVELERRAGRPICATCNTKKPGYFLPETREDMVFYIRRLKHREAEIAATREALTAQLMARADETMQAAPDGTGTSFYRELTGGSWDAKGGGADGNRKKKRNSRAR